MSAADNLRAFDPNKPEFHPWATWVSHAGFKIHRTRAVAITRFNQHDYALLYKMGDEGQWEELLRKCREDENHTCSVCHGSTLLPEDQLQQHGLFPRSIYMRRGPSLHDDTVTPHIYDAGRFVIERKNRKIVYPFVQHFLCVHCWPAFT